MSRDVRINYTLEERDEDGDWQEVGFGSSGTWSDLDAAVHAVASDVQNGAWEDACR